MLEAIESVGLGNWADIADHVGTKSLEECRDHYIKYYLETPTYPLPDLSNRLDDDAVNQARKKRQTSPCTLFIDWERLTSLNSEEACECNPSFKGQSDAQSSG